MILTHSVHSCISEEDYDYKILYSSITRLFHLQKFDENHVAREEDSGRR